MTKVRGALPNFGRGERRRHAIGDRRVTPPRTNVGVDMRKVAGSLIALGISLGLVGAFLFNKATKDAESRQSVNELADAMMRDAGLLGVPDDDIRVAPNRTGPIALWAVGGLAVLSGVILLSANPATSSSAAGRINSDLASQLSELARLHASGDLSDAEYATSKQALLRPKQSELKTPADETTT